MKNIFLTLSLMLCAVLGLLAQDCASGCPETIMVHHQAGQISPETIDISYPTSTLSITGSNKCWIMQNLGASESPNSFTDVTSTNSGWYWQFNRKQGYAFKDDVTYPSVKSVTPAHKWISSGMPNNGDWMENDPCRLLLGGKWRLPSGSEWHNVVSSNQMTSSTLAYELLKLTGAGFIHNNGNTATNISYGASGYYWSSFAGYNLNAGICLIAAGSSVSSNGTHYVGLGCSVRCLKEL